MVSPSSRLWISSFLSGFIDGHQLATPNDEDLLRFFTVYVKSKLASYFLFHTAGSWGTERDRCLSRTHAIAVPLARQPAFQSARREIVKEVASRMKELQEEIEKLYDPRSSLDTRNRETRKGQIKRLQADLEPLVYEYFDLSEEEKDDSSRIRATSTTKSTRRRRIGH